MRRRGFVAIGAALVVVAAVAVTAVLAFPSGPVGRAVAGERHLPASLEGSVTALCMPDVNKLIGEIEAARTQGAASASGIESFAFSTEGTGGSFKASVEAPGFWRVDASRAGVTLASETGTADRSAAPALTPAALTVARQLYACMSRYRFVDETTPLASSSQLVQWYRYDATVLWPCLAAHGLDVGSAPSREDFSDPFRAQGVDPFRGLHVTKRTLPQLLAAVQQCPLRPSYLR